MRAGQACPAACILSGAHCSIDWGYPFVAVGADVGLLARDADPLAKKF
jgi:2-keto-3-deoxy-L-rhamnonate aldolase RhmA